jgi:hypothetical protein
MWFNGARLRQELTYGFASRSRADRYGRAAGGCSDPGGVNQLVRIEVHVVRAGV